MHTLIETQSDPDSLTPYDMRLPSRENALPDSATVPSSENVLGSSSSVLQTKSMPRGRMLVGSRQSLVGKLHCIVETDLNTDPKNSLCGTPKLFKHCHCPTKISPYGKESSSRRVYLQATVAAEEAAGARAPFVAHTPSYLATPPCTWQSGTTRSTYGSEPTSCCLYRTPCCCRPVLWSKMSSPPSRR